MTTSQGRRQTIEQERGRIAWADVQKIKGKKFEQEYRSLARGLNSMIQINGLGQTLGFLKAKGKNEENRPHYQLLMHLTDWMQDEKHFKAPNREVIKGKSKPEYDGLLRWVTDEKTTSADYRRATTECLAFGAWLRRFAEAELQEPETEGSATPV